MDNDSRAKFDLFYRDLLAGKYEDKPMPKEVGKLEAVLPADHLVYDYYYEVN